jgi:hypothetical protein
VVFVASISRIEALTNRLGAHWQSTWKRDRYASERTKLVADTHALMLDSLTDRTAVVSTLTLEAERNYFEEFDRVIAPKKKSLDFDREIASLEKAVNKRVKNADGILESFFQKSNEEAELHFFISPSDRPAGEGQEMRRLEKIAEELRGESLALLVEGLSQGGSGNKSIRYLANRQKVADKLDKINGLITKLKASEERLRADVDYGKGELDNFDTPLAKAYYKANTYRGRTVRFFRKLYANPRNEMIRQAAAHPLLAVSAVGMIGLGAVAATPVVYSAIAPYMSIKTAWTFLATRSLMKTANSMARGLIAGKK